MLGREPLFMAAHRFHEALREICGDRLLMRHPLTMHRDLADEDEPTRESGDFWDPLQVKGVVHLCDRRALGVGVTDQDGFDPL